MQPDLHLIRTADNVGVGYETAGIGSRLVAFLLDLLPITALSFCIELLLVSLVPDGGPGLIFVATAVPFFAMLGYFVVAETAGEGRTPGKRALQLRVVRCDGGAPGFQEAALRGLARIVDLAVGWPWMFFHPQSRRLGDLVAGTVVVRERRAGAAMPSLAPRLTATPDEGPAIDGMAGLGRREYAAITALLLRGGLAPEQRHRLAVTMAERLYDRLGLAPDAPERQWSAELFLERLYLQLGARLAPADPAGVTAWR